MPATLTIDWKAKKALREKRGTLLAEMEKVLKSAEKEKRALTAEENAKFEELNGEAEELQSTLQKYERMEELAAERRQADPLDAAIEDDDDRKVEVAKKAAAEQRAQFDRWLRTGRMPDDESMRSKDKELRSLVTSGMGVVGDRPFANQLVVAMKAFTGVRIAGARILTRNNGNPLTIPTADDTSNTGAIVAEAGDNSATADPTLGKSTVSPVMFHSKWIKVSLELLRDNEYDLIGFLSETGGERIGRALNTYTTTGTGTGQPQGVVTASTEGKVAASTSAITYEELLDLTHSIDPAYRESGRCRLMFHDTTLAAIRKLKDSDNRYIFSAGENGAPGTVCGYPYVINRDMAQLSSGVSSKVALIGDFSYYTVCDVTPPDVVQARELFIQSGLIGFDVFSRHDGRLTNTAAVKHLALAAA